MGSNDGLFLLLGLGAFIYFSSKPKTNGLIPSAGSSTYNYYVRDSEDSAQPSTEREIPTVPDGNGGRTGTRRKTKALMASPVLAEELKALSIRRAPTIGRKRFY